MLKKCISVFDENHRFAPVYDENDCITLECENVLLSIGQTILWGNLLKDTAVELRPNQTAQADPVTYQTAEPDIFVGGDVFTGPKFAIDAIAAGKQGCVSIHRFVHKGHSLTLGRDLRQFVELDKKQPDIEEFDTAKRQIPGQKIRNRKRNLPRSAFFSHRRTSQDRSRSLSRMRSFCRG